MSRLSMQVARGVAIAALAGGAATALPAQVANTSAAHAGTSNTRSALARGYEAISLNPAGLAMPDAPKWSLSVLSGQASVSGGPVSYNEMRKQQNKLVPREVKEDWINRIDASDGQVLEGVASLSGVAFTWGRLGVQLSGTGLLFADVNDDAAELMLYGNAGRTGVPADFDMEESGTNNTVVGNIAVAYGLPVPLRLGSSANQAASVGATLHYTQGLLLVNGSNAGTRITGDPVELSIQFPIVVEGFEGTNNLGSGVGLDLGAMWTNQQWTASLGLRNLFNTFAFDLDKIEFRPASAVFSGDTVGVTQFDPRPMSEAPQELQDAINELTYHPSIDAAVAYQASSSVMVTGEFRHQFDNLLESTPKTYGGAGVQYTGLARWLTLYGGAGTFGSRTQFSAGVGLDWIGLRLQLSATRRSGGDADAQGIFGLTLGYTAAQKK